jgi:hypothetical protein
MDEEELEDDKGEDKEKAVEKNEDEDKEGITKINGKMDLEGKADEEIKDIIRKEMDDKGKG